MHRDSQRIHLCCITIYIMRFLSLMFSQFELYLIEIPFENVKPKFNFKAFGNIQFQLCKGCIVTFVSVTCCVALRFHFFIDLYNFVTDSL